ncbi:GPI inositol-deacylase [Mycena sanguinolenta]|uniref:GPI inositol-deacylase n=1 Tax=Mycena sanguinolenta TaxID=230812 RepID=A0A8H7D1I8_9AGAR|nr:GPI inositol-deacylase [Mycena sanguinolenta]
MSYMYPSYVLQSEFDVAWTPLAKRYSLWLYREVDAYGNGWELTHVSNGVPVLFIPGNAGSSRQVRSIASSAVRQYYDAPFSVASEFRSRPNLKPLDFFTVEFNEDLSAFHGPTLEAQTEYTSRAIAYILSLYPPRNADNNYGALDGRHRRDVAPPLDQYLCDHHYEHPAHASPGAIRRPHRRAVRAQRAHTHRRPDANPKPLRRRDGHDDSFRGVCSPERRCGHTLPADGILQSAGASRAALELAGADFPAGRGAILDRWLRDGHALPSPLLLPDPDPAPAHTEVLPAEMSLVLKHPHGARTTHANAKFVLLVAQGSVGNVGPQTVRALKAEVFKCGGIAPYSDGRFRFRRRDRMSRRVLSLFETDVPWGGTTKWVGVKMEGGEGEGWIVGGFVVDEPFKSSVSTMNLLLGQVSVPLVDLGMRASFEFPNLLSNTLVVYRITPHHKISENPCADPLLAPLLVHTSHPSETHYFPLTVFPSHRILLHTHAAAPHVHSERAGSPGLRFTIYSSGSLSCKSDLVGFDLTIDWSATLGRWASRYFTVVPTWAVGVVAVILFQAWGASEANGPTSQVPTVEQSLASFTGKPLQGLLLCSIVLSAVPLPESFYLGNRGQPLFSIIAPLLLLISTGFVCLSWWMLQALIWPLGKLGRFRRRREETSVHRSTVISMGLIFLLIFLFVPWQVAFLGCWTIYLYNCAASKVHVAHIASIPDTVAIPLLRREGEPTVEEAPRARPAPPPAHIGNNHNHSMHLLLLMTWLLPLAAPVLVVWRALTTPFDGDHFFLSAAPFLILVDFASWTNGPLFERQSFERLFTVRWSFACLAAAAFLLGSRKAYFVFDVAKGAIGLVVLVRIGPRYWGRRSWSPAQIQPQ